MTLSQLDHIQPVVLVGGQSRRFGRDKLREPVGDGSRWLVDVPIAALRDVFGRRVALVGNCDSSVAARGDFQIPDRYAGRGPSGGLLSALEYSFGDVFLLAGDLPRIDGAVVRRVVEAFQQALLSKDLGDSWAAVATVAASDGDRLEPCVGLYGRHVRDTLRERVNSGRLSLHDLVPRERLVTVPIDALKATNVNTMDAMPS